jgi:hypothetical protein
MMPESPHSTEFTPSAVEGLRAGSGRAEGSIYCGCFGGFAAKTTEKDTPSMLPQAKHACGSASNYADCVTA